MLIKLHRIITISVHLLIITSRCINIIINNNNIPKFQQPYLLKLYTLLLSETSSRILMDNKNNLTKQNNGRIYFLLLKLITSASFFQANIFLLLSYFSLRNPRGTKKGQHCTTFYQITKKRKSADMTWLFVFPGW
jgi:dolichol kinase